MKKYRDAFYQIDKAYYSTHKKPRDKLKPRIPGGNSKRKLHDDTPTFAIKTEFHTIQQEESGLRGELNANGPFGDLNDSTSSISSLNESQSLPTSSIESDLSPSPGSPIDNVE